MPINSVTIVGNLTRDPEAKALPSGTTVCELGVAVNERVKGQNGEWEDRASFFDVSVFGGSADACVKFLAKGRQVAIAGRLRQERWKTKDGDNRSRVRIVANDVQFIGGRDEQPTGLPAATSSGWVGGSTQDQGDFGGPQQVPPSKNLTADESDLPF